MSEVIETLDGDEFEYAIRTSDFTQTLRLELKRNGKSIPGVAVTDELAQRHLNRGVEGVADLIGLFVGATINSLQYTSAPTRDSIRVTHSYQEKNA